MITDGEEIHVEFATETLGCLTMGMALLTPATVWMFGFADLSDSSGRRAGFARMVQSIQIYDVPVIAVAFGCYLLYQTVISGWRWSDRIALSIGERELLLHPSIIKSPIKVNSLISVSTKHRGAYGIKTVNPSLIIRWNDPINNKTKQRVIPNVKLDSLSGTAFKQYLVGMGKWLEAK